MTDIAAAAERVRQAGGRDVSGIQTVRAPGTVARHAFFRGPDGESVELMELVSGAFQARRRVRVLGATWSPQRL